MDLKRERALRVVASLEQRTVARGCTPAEEQQAGTKAAEIRKRYAIGAAEQLPGAGADVLDIEIDPQALSIILGFTVFYGQTFVREQVRRKKKVRRPGSRARFAQFWRR